MAKLLVYSWIEFTLKYNAYNGFSKLSLEVVFDRCSTNIAYEARSFCIAINCNACCSINFERRFIYVCNFGCVTNCCSSCYDGWL